MRSRKLSFPPYRSVIGPGTEVTGSISFDGGLHVDGRVVGDVTGRHLGSEASASAISIAATGVVEGNLDVPHVVIDGTVYGDVRAAQRAVLASRARIQGTVFYGTLEMDRGAEVQGELVPLDSGGATETSEDGPGPLEPGDVGGGGAEPGAGARSPDEGSGPT